VKVLRTGGEYLAAEARHCGSRYLWILAIGGVLAIIVALALHPVLAMIPVLIAASQARPAYRRLARVQHGAQGEEEVTRLLSRLSDEYVLVNDVVLPRGFGNIDHVVLGPCGIVVIETKRYKGHISCHRGKWFQNGRPIQGVGRQANRGAIAIREFLSEEHPQLKATALRWIHSLVVFTHPLCSLELDRPDASVARYSELLDFIRARGRRDQLVPSVARTLAHTLVRTARVQDLDV
jgi:hypothetical protein